MAKMTRKLAMALAAAVVLSAPQASAAAQDAALNTRAAAVDSHVRSHNPAIVTLIQQASERSATFRALLATLNASDSYVYVSEGECNHGARACFVSVSKAGTSRMMWVRVVTRKAYGDEDLMGSIGHELRHTIEVLAVPTVNSPEAMFMFYAGLAFHGTGGGYETKAAVDAGEAVRSEVRAFNRHSKSE